MTHIEVLEALAQIYGRPRYLEIGVGDGGCFQRVLPHCSWGVAVDVTYNPYGSEVAARLSSLEGATYRGGGSDAFFAEYRDYASDDFDLIFIDGDHHEEQVRKDWLNALQVLSPLGTIALHDTWAATEQEASEGSDTAYHVAEEIERDPAFDCYTIPVRPGLTLARPRKARFT